MLRREAARWLARLQSGRDPAAEAKFLRWHDAHPSHAAAFERVSKSYGQAALLRHSKSIARPSASEPKPIASAAWRYALAAAVALLLLVPAGLLFFREAKAPFGGAGILMLETRIGEIKHVRLNDGSEIILDAATKLNVDVAARKARLEQGRARFSVANASRPFTIEADGTTITTDHGIIDAQAFADQNQVDVLGGKAMVRRFSESAGASIAINAGERLATGLAQPTQIQHSSTALDWTRGMLQFDGTPLKTAVALSNSYSKQQILIDKNLEQLRVTGAFRAGDTAGFAKALARAFKLSLHRMRDGNLMLSPRPH